jgi:hypothetical protein
MFLDDTEVEDTAVESTTEDLEDNDSDNESTGEDEAKETTKGDEQSKPKETPEARRARIKRQYEREFGKQDEKGSQESGKESSKEGEEKYNRLALKYEGYTDKAEQDEIISYATWKGIDVEEAMKVPVVQAAVAEIRNKKSVPSPSVRTGKGGVASVDTLVARYKAGKKLTVDEMKQVRKKLRG